MYTQKFLTQDEALKEKWQTKFSKIYGDREFKMTTSSGLPVKPFYTAGDIKEMNSEDLGVPGEYPYTRGIYPVHYQFQPWMNEQIHGYGLPEQTRERMEILSQHGMEGYFGGAVHNIVGDLASNAGYDPDDSRAEGWVGQGGVAIYTVEDMGRLIHDLPLDKTNFVWNIQDTSMAMLALYIVAAEKMGFPKEKLRGNTLNSLYRRWCWDCIGFPPENAFKLMVELIAYCTREMPKWNTTTITGYCMEEAGGTPVQETAFVMATSIALTDKCIEAGLKPDDFLPRIGFHIGQGNDFFENIAKLRVMRKMWAKINKERFDCKNPKAMQARMFVQTSGASLTSQQPLNNIARAAFQTLGAILGGANGIQTDAYDEAISIPTEEAAILALRTQQIVRHETKVPSVSDPLAGSYYMESLTNQIESEAYKLIQEIDDLGGYIKCWTDGWLSEELRRSAYEWRERVNNGEEILVGVNKYVSSETQEVPFFSVDESIGEISVERIKEYRKKRDNMKTQSALADLRQAAIKIHESNGGEGLLMGALIDAFRAEATLGEAMEVIKEELGFTCEQ
ncbi:methylmalonyl-CoA mutase family protein [Thermodesulfobacteriota bacterium]